MRHVVSLTPFSRTFSVISSSSKATISLIERAPRFKSSPLSALDALRDVHLVFAGEQRDYAHLAQVDACRVLNRFKKAWGLVDFDGLAELYLRLKLFVEGRGSWPGLALKHVNAPHAHGDKQVV